MSRVYDAMRRKASEQNGAVPQADDLSGWNTPDRADDAFAELESEVAAAPQREEAANPVGTQEIRTINVPAPATTSRDVPSALFEHIDIRYQGKTILDSAVSPQSREQYRRLAASLHHAQAVSGIKVVMVTSALVGEGKTLTASNIAMTLSQSYQKEVLLVDADFRRPSVHAVFGISSSPGLAESLVEQTQKIRVRLVSSRLGVLTGGRPTSDPIAALTSQRMRLLVQEARNTFDWIVLDTPPVALLPDANLVSSMADGALIVVKAGETPWHLVDRAVQAVGRDRTLGVVLNRVAGNLPSAGYYEYYDYYATPAITAG